VQPITLTDEQKDFRAASAELAEERFAPGPPRSTRPASSRGTTSRTAWPWTCPAWPSPSSTAGPGADHVTQGHHGRGAGPGLRVDQPHDGHQRPVGHPDRQLGDPRSSRPSTCRVLASGEMQGSYCLSEVRRRQRRGGDEDPGGARRGLLRAQRPKYWITNAGISDIYVVFAKTDPAPGPGGSPASSSSATTVCGSASSSTRWACTAARPARSSSTTFASRRPT
jgi:alkylation response protein AidB-like acyl-CoA dehydrogenase